MESITLGVVIMIANENVKIAIIGLYREIAIAIQKESGDSNGGNV